MNIEEFREYCLSLKGVHEKMPFPNVPDKYSQDVLCFYVASKWFCFVNIEVFDFCCIKCNPDEMEELRATYTGIKIDDFGGNAVDRANLRDLRTILAKKPDEPLLHFPGGRLGVGHGQDRVRRDPAAAEHIAQPGHQHRGFSAAGYGQKQHRAVYGVNSFQLLRIESRCIVPVKFASGHADDSSGLSVAFVS